MISLSVTSLRTNAQDAVSLNQGDKAPFTGILMTPSLSNDLRKAVIELDSIKAQNESLNKIVKLQDDNFLHQQQKVGILLEQNDKLALRLGEERTVGTWQKVGYFSLGIVAVLAGAYGISKVPK